MYTKTLLCQVVYTTETRERTSILKSCVIYERRGNENGQEDTGLIY